LAAPYGIDRSTIRSICATAKQGALDALTRALPGRRGKSAEQVELEAARARIAALESTVWDQAMRLAMIEGKERWD
jgi:hypothetical protein